MTIKSKPETLITRCQAVIAGAGEALDWISDVRHESARVDQAASSIIDDLRRYRISAKRLAAAAARPMAVGFFGLSQAGKSYLISVLARGADGSVETVMDGQRLNFISHINPPGSGKEATGIVTRFTRQAAAGPSGFPVALALLSEADLLKIIGNSFFLDFDQQKVSVDIDPEQMDAHIDQMKKLAQPAETGGLSADDVLDVMDYYKKRFPRSMGAFDAAFWPQAIALVPRLKPTDRARFFLPLWGGVEELADAYLRLRDGLTRLGHAEAGFAELTALVKPDNAGGFSQSDSIMNVDMLARLGRDDGDLVNVAPVVGGEVRSSVGIPRSLLAALSREMAFSLAEPPQAPMLETVDLLDFPGYRGRLKVANLKDVAEKLENRDPVAELFLRGKVAYLFERYTDDQEMNVLVMCAPSHKQSDVNDVGEALTRWIDATQGATAQERSKRMPGLIWALTMFDMRLTPRPDETEDLIRTGWSGMMDLALVERFKAFDWLRNWTAGQPFTNLFLVRKPGMAAGVIRAEGRRETQVEPDQVDRLAMLRRTFVGEALVQRHFVDPAKAWDAVMRLDDGGMSDILAYLEKVALPEQKLVRIAEQVDAMVTQFAEYRFSAFYRAGGAEEEAKKREIAQKVVRTLSTRASYLGELLAAMQPSSEHLRALYLRAESDARDSETLADAPALGGGFISLDLEIPVADVVAPVISGEQLFVQAVVSAWEKQLRALPVNPDVRRFIGVGQEDLQFVVDELLSGASRFGLAGGLADALREAEERSGTTRARLVDQQVLVARNEVSEFVDTLGFADLPESRRPKSRKFPNRRIFDPQPPLTKPLALDERPMPFSAIRILDWLEGFETLAVENVGHDGGRDISSEQNQRLGAILARVRGAA